MDWDTLPLLQSGVSGPLCTVNKSEAFINPEVSDSKASLLKLSRSPDPPVLKKKLLFQDYRDNSNNVFSSLCNIFRNSYFLYNLSHSDYDRIKNNIISFGNGKFNDIENYEFWPIYQVHNKLQFAPIIYDKINNTIFKPHQPILKCDNCEKNWKVSSLQSIKNKFKIICDNCQQGNKIIKLKTCKNINNDILIFETKREKKFIDWANDNNILLLNGPIIDSYKINFQINDSLIILCKNKMDNPDWDTLPLLQSGVSGPLRSPELKNCIFITPHNCKQMIKEILNIIK
jgi:hypothetical protein